MATTKIGIRSFQVTDHDRGGTVAWDVGGSLSFIASGEVGETVNAANRPAVGRKVTQMAGKFSVEGIDAGRVPIATIQSWANVTAVAALANGTVKTLTGHCVGQPELNTLEGTVSFDLEGITSEMKPL